MKSVWPCYPEDILSYSEFIFSQKELLCQPLSACLFRCSFLIKSREVCAVVLQKRKKTERKKPPPPPRARRFRYQHYEIMNHRIFSCKEQSRSTGSLLKQASAAENTEPSQKRQILAPWVSGRGGEM